MSQYKLVTIEATPRIAEKITVAQSIGTISLSLRALADNAAELEQALASGEINIPTGATADEEQAIMKSAAQRPTAGKSSYATGGDVSRFQRSTVPAQMPLAVAAETARTQILLRFRNELFATYRAYLDADRRTVTAAIESLHDKYAVTVRDIEQQRSDAAAELDGYLKALGYV